MAIKELTNLIGTFYLLDIGIRYPVGLIGGDIY